MYPYQHHFAQKDEIKKTIHELLDIGFIRPNNIPYLSSIVMVLKEGACVDFHALSKLKVKCKFPILVIYDLLDELHSAMFFTKLYLHSKYHQIQTYKRSGNS